MALDTSAVVAALASWHTDHRAASEALKQALCSGDVLVVPVPVLVEAYSVMTRLPAPNRISPADAAALLERNFRDRAVLVGLVQLPHR